MNFTSIDNVRNEDFSVVWDLGRRCTYSCSYCGPHHSNKTSPLVNIDDLKHTIDGVVEYSNLLNQYRRIPKTTTVAYTGGEPTIHPDFFPFVLYTKEKYPELFSNITTNGCFNEKKCLSIMKCIDSTTISYHTEASDKEKKLVKNNIEIMNDFKYPFRINLMFHKDHFEECIEVSNWLNELNVIYTPRPIGDSDNEKDILDGTAHVYNEEQLLWFENYWKTSPSFSYIREGGTDERKKKKNKLETKKEKSKEKMASSNIGRPCCNGKCMKIKIDEQVSEQTFVPSTNFQGWNCMVNWDFLFIHSELDKVWHHQTCQINLNGEMGSIGKASEFNMINKKLKNILQKGKFPVIKCPKTYCGCGLCSPKALYDSDFLNIFESRTKNLEPIIQENAIPLDNRNSIVKTLKKLDAK